MDIAHIKQNELLLLSSVDFLDYLWLITHAGFSLINFLSTKRTNRSRNCIATRRINLVFIGIQDIRIERAGWDERLIVVKKLTIRMLLKYLMQLYFIKNRKNGKWSYQRVLVYIQHSGVTSNLCKFYLVDQGLHSKLSSV